MSQIIFPVNPTDGQQFVAGAVTYTWNSDRWVSTGPSAASMGATGPQGDPGGATGATGNIGSTGIQGPSFVDGSDISAGVITASELSVSGLATASLFRGRLEGTLFNSNGNPVLDPDGPDYGGNVYGNIMSPASGISTFNDLNVTGVSTFAEIAVSGLATASLFRGRLEGTLFNSNGNPVLDPNGPDYGGNVYGNIMSPASGISTFNDLNVTGVVTSTFFYGDGSNLTGIATQSVLGAMCFTYRYDSSTDTNSAPSNGRIRFNNSNPQNATAIAISDTNGYGVDISNFFGLFGSGSKVYIQDERDASKFMLLTLNAGGSNQGSWYMYTNFTVDLSNNVTNLNKLVVCVQPQGPAGPQGATGVGTDATGFVWNDNIIPDTNSAYDIGSAEYKVRHLFLSDNSVYTDSGEVRVGFSTQVGTSTKMLKGTKLQEIVANSVDFADFKVKMASEDFGSL